MIYFIRDDASGAIKIGKADDPGQRLKGLQIGCPHPLFLVGAIPGGEGDEARLHRRFARFLHRGEWFKGDDEFLDPLLGLIERYRLSYGVADRSRAGALYSNDRARFYFSTPGGIRNTNVCIGAMIGPKTGHVPHVYWGEEPSMTGAEDRPCSFQIMPVNDDSPFWHWHICNNPQWYASPGDAAHAFIRCHQFWAEHVRQHRAEGAA